MDPILVVTPFPSPLSARLAMAALSAELIERLCGHVPPVGHAVTWWDTGHVGPHASLFTLSAFRFLAAVEFYTEESRVPSVFQFRQSARFPLIVSG